MLGDKQGFSVAVASNEKRELLEFKTDSAKDFWGWDEKLELLECYEDWRELKELTAELLEVILRCSVRKKLSPNKKVLNKSPCILNVSRSRM